MEVRKADLEFFAARWPVCAKQEMVTEDVVMQRISQGPLCDQNEVRAVLFIHPAKHLVARWPVAATLRVLGVVGRAGTTGR